MSDPSDTLMPECQSRERAECKNPCGGQDIGNSRGAMNMLEYAKIIGEYKNRKGKDNAKGYGNSKIPSSNSRPHNCHRTENH